MDSPRSASPGSYEETRPRTRKTVNYNHSTTTSNLTQSLKFDTPMSANSSGRQTFGYSVTSDFMDKMSSPQSERKQFQQRGLERIGTVTEGMLDQISHSDGKDGKRIDDKKIAIPGVKFVDKADWKDSPSCFVCSRTFDKMKGVFTHHCRVCGKACCGDCSTKKVNEQRICDVCYFRFSNSRAEERRKDMIKNKRATIETYKLQLKKEKDEAASVRKARLELEEKINNDKSEQERAKTNLQREKDRAQETLTKKMENNKKLKESLEVDKCCLRDKEVEYEELKTKINSLKLEIQQKRTILKTKKEEYFRLDNQKQTYETSPSFVNMTEQNITNSETNSTKNYSIMSSDINGRVSLAKEPTRF